MNNTKDNNEVCPLAEGGCGNRDGSWCCGCARDDTGRLYQPEVCKVSEGGCGNRDISWCCGCARDETGRLFQPEVCKVSEGGCGNRDSLYICDCDCDIETELPIPLSYNSRLTRETTMGYGCALTRSEPSPMWTPTPLSRQATTSCGLTRQATLAPPLVPPLVPPRLMREQTYINNIRYEDSDEEHEYDEEKHDTFHTPNQSPKLPSMPPPITRPPPLTRQDTMGICCSHNYDNNYDEYDEPFPSRLQRQVCTGSLVNENFRMAERSTIINLNGRIVDLRNTGDIQASLQIQPPNSPDIPQPRPGGETPPPIDETPPMPNYYPKLYRGFNNKQQVMDILPVLRSWLVIQNDPDIDYEDEVWRDTRDSITDQMRRFVNDIDWWVLGAKGGPWEYCVETPECFASTMGINDPNISYGSYKNENKGLFTKRQIELIYNTMMENTRIAMKMETINKLFEF